MKTQIIQLDSQDDVASVRDKISWGQSDRILLVWPNQRAALHNKLDLLLLQRHAAATGSRLALVSRDASASAAAAEIGLPIFRTIRLAQSMPWERAPLPERQPRPTSGRYDELRAQRGAANKPLPKPENPTLRIVAFFIAILAFASLLSIFVPRATLTLQPETRSQSLQLNLIADSNLPTFNLGGQLPYRRATHIMEGRQSLPTTGQAAIALEPARGTALLSNLTDLEITIPAGARIRTVDSNAPAFFTLVEVTLGSTPGAQAEVRIEAESAGTAGNLPVNSLTAIEGDLGLSVSVSNPEALTGGLAQSARAAAPEDLEAAYSALLNSLWISAQEEIQVQQPGVLLLDTQPDSYAILEEDYSLSPGEPGNELELLLRVEFSIAYIPDKLLADFATAVLDASPASGFEPILGSTTVSLIDVPIRLESGNYQAVVLISRNLQAALDPLAISREISGNSPARAAARLSETLALVSPPQIQVAPAWWPWLPLLPAQFQINP